MARTTAQTNPATGQAIYVGDGAVKQQGPKKLYTCNACGGDVVWLESKRTGKVYLASVYRGEVARYYVSKPHVCRVVEPKPVRESKPIDDEYDALTARFLAREITREELVAEAAAIDAKYGVGQ